MDKKEIELEIPMGIIQQRNYSENWFRWKYEQTPRTIKPGPKIDRINLFVPKELANFNFKASGMKDITTFPCTNKDDKNIKYGAMICIHYFDPHKILIRQIHSVVVKLFYEGFFNLEAYHGIEYVGVSALIRRLFEHISLCYIEFAIDLSSEYYDLDYIYSNTFRDKTKHWKGSIYLDYKENKKSTVIFYDKKLQLSERKDIKINHPSLFRLEFRFKSQQFRFMNTGALSETETLFVKPEKMFHILAIFLICRSRYYGIDHNFLKKPTRYLIVNYIFGLPYSNK